MAGQSTPLKPTYDGYINSTMDALLLFEACLSGQLNHVPRRPHDRERQDLIKSGNIFIYEEHASGIKRWTDGVSWSPSRILGNFLIYRELEKPFPPGEKKRALKKNKKCQGVTKNENPSSRPSSSIPSGVIDPSTINKDTERSLIGSLVDSYPFKASGLVKKTISITYQGVPHHLVSYYNIEDVQAGRLMTPSKDAMFQNLHPRPELLMSQNFRAPLDEIEYHGEEQRGGMFMTAAGYMHPVPGAPEFVAHTGILPRTLSLPSFQHNHSPVYSATPQLGFLPPPPPQPHHHHHHHQQQPPQQDQHHHHHHHHHQHQHQQNAYLSSVSSTAPSTSMQYMPPSAGNYALDPNRATRFPSHTGISNEFPRNMPAEAPPRRHSTFEAAQPAEMTNLALNSLQDARSLPTVNGFMPSPSNSYFLPHRTSQLMEPDQQFQSPRIPKTEPDTLINGNDGVAQAYGLEDNSATWAYQTALDGPPGESQYYNHPSEAAHPWQSAEDGLSRA